MYYLMHFDNFPQITQCYTVTRNTVWQIADKDHILIFVKEGYCAISYGGEAYTLQPGDIFFIPSNHSYTRRSIEGTMCTMSYVHFALSSEAVQLDFGELRERILNARNSLDNMILNDASVHSGHSELYMQNKLTLPNWQHAFALLDDIQHFSNRRQLTSGMQSSINLCSILSSLSQHTIECVASGNLLNSTTTVPANLKKAIQYIRSHYSEQITLDDLAQHCGVSKQQLIRYFKAAFKITPIVYITDYKIAKAKDLLFNQPHLTIKEISDELGFNNQHYFTKVFIKTTGESPSEYRSRIANYLAAEAKENQSKGTHEDEKESS